MIPGLNKLRLPFLGKNRNLGAKFSLYYTLYMTFLDFSYYTAEKDH